MEARFLLEIFGTDRSIDMSPSLEEIEQLIPRNFAGYVAITN
jgi:hypothetical protein